MSQRLKGLSHEEATGVAKEVFTASDRFLGRTSNLVRILSNHSPYIARWFLGLVATVRQPDLGAATDARLRNLANIKTSMTNACEYCTAHTSIYGKGLGIGAEEIAALDGDGYKTSPLFNDKEKAVIAWAEAMTRNTAQRDKAVWEELKRHCTDVEIAEVSMACAMFNMINRLNDSFWTELETPEYNEKQWNAVEDLSIDDVEAYAGRFATVGQAQRNVP
ncbi:MAG TPA: carboxymuconolactone decarboxylase family protein [Gammaproteobacteria bacterium]|nr:carboxymuconolactone decarboxylase family protein [Gammaproteobacteria bacterium]